MNINNILNYIYLQLNNLYIILLMFLDSLVCHYNLYIIYFYTYGTILYYVLQLTNSVIASLWIFYFKICTFKLKTWFFVCFQPLFIYLELVFNVFRFYYDFLIFLFVFKYLPAIRFYLISRLNDFALYLYYIYRYSYTTLWEPYIYPFLFSHYLPVRVAITRLYWDLTKECKLFLYFYVVISAFIKTTRWISIFLFKWIINNSRRFYYVVWKYWKIFWLWYVRRFIKWRGVFQFTMRRFFDYFRRLDLVWRRNTFIRTCKALILVFRNYERRNEKASGKKAFGLLRTNKVHSSNLYLFEILQFPFYDPRVIICFMVYFFVDSSKLDNVKYLDTESDFFRWKHRYKFVTPFAYWHNREPFNAVSEKFFDYFSKSKVRERLKLYIWMLQQIPIQIFSIFFEYWCFRRVAMKLLKKFTFYKTYRRYHWTHKWYRKVIVLAPIAFCYAFIQIVKKISRVLIVNIFNIIVFLLLDLLAPFRSRSNFKTKNTMFFILLMSWFESYIGYRKKPFLREIFYKRKLWFIPEWPYVLQHNVFPLVVREVLPIYTKLGDPRVVERWNLDSLTDNNDLDKAFYSRKSLFKYLKNQLYKKL